jgi:hypothetical protein
MKIRFTAIFMLMIAASLLVLSACGEVKDGKYAEIAKCMTEKGVKMYGAYWCSHCLEQKKLFGDDLRYVNYVECDPGGKDSKREECVAAGVKSYPTWFFPGQDLQVGVTDPVELAKKANCDVGTLTTQQSGTASNTQASGTISAVPVPDSATVPVTAEPQPVK